MGKTCGDGTRVVYSELRAISRTSGAAFRVQGKECILRPNIKRDAASRRWNLQRFGGCGQPPTLAPTLPSTICGNGSLKISDSNGTFIIASPQPRPSPSPASPGPDPPSLPPSPSPPTGPPSQPPPPPSQPTTQPLARPLPRVPVAAGERLPSNIIRIQGADAAVGVASSQGLPNAQQVVVGVVDSGVDSTHPDIFYAGGRSWVNSSVKFPNDFDPANDYHGHGTHIAGTVAARNNGAGVVGMSPGLPVYSLKVLDGSGRGSLANLLSAVTWVIAEGKALGIRVLNLSLGVFADEAAEDYAAAVAGVCDVFKKASDAGIVCVVAAGNFGSSIRSYLPGACPTVATVTAVDDSRAASWSNFLPSYDSSDAEKGHVIAAPGANVLSTISFAKDPSGYRVLSGTSMAAPHIAGIAANCLMSGACDSAATGADQLNILQAAAKEKYALDAAYGFTGDPTNVSAGKYYGFLAWAGKF
eukprot:gene1764-2103_t